MQVRKLDHINLRTAELDRMIEWYADILGLNAGPRPNFPFPGAWLYAGEEAIIHLVATDGDPGVGSEEQLKMEHFALAANGLTDFLARLQDRGIEFQKAEIADFGIIQINVWDPDGNHIHVDFRADEQRA